MLNKLKGYRIERKIRLLLEKSGWEVVRSGGSLGIYDLIAFREGKCVFFQVKSTKKDKFYYSGYSKARFVGFPFLLVVDFGRNVIRVTEPSHIVDRSAGHDIRDFLHNLRGNSFQ